MNAINVCKLENFEIAQWVEVKGIFLLWAAVYGASGVLQRYAVIYLYGDSQRIAVLESTQKFISAGHEPYCFMVVLFYIVSNLLYLN